MLAFIIDYPQEKLTSQTFFKKFQKPYFGPILGPFAQIGVKNEFSWKERLFQLFNIQITYHCAKKSEKPNETLKDTPKTSLFH